MTNPETSLTRAQVLRQRSRRLRRLSRVYSDYYWSLIEELKAKHRDFVWRYGSSPSRDQNNNEDAAADDDNNGVVTGDDEGIVRCKANGCKSKAMALTRFCLLHILMDANQVLYKGCAYRTRSSPSGPVSCMKPIIRSAVPSLCPVHLDKAEKTMKAALKKAGYNNTTTANKVAPKCNVLIAEAVRQIQSKRRVAKRAHLDDKSEAKDDC